MKVLLCHNYYQQRGGEDEVFDSERKLLESHGHSVLTHTVSNTEINSLNRWMKGINALWSWETHRNIGRLIDQFSPDIIHFHNIFPLLSPSGYYAAHSRRIPVVQTLHNFRALCINATFHRKGEPCEACLTHQSPWPGVRYGCYRASKTQSLAPAMMNSLHQKLETWQTKVDLFLVFSMETMGKKYAQGGFPKEKMFVKPNFLAPDPGYGSGSGEYALFVGRLEDQKGIRDLLAAWSMGGSRPPLKIIGDGPMLAYAKEQEKSLTSVEVLGRLGLDETLQYMKNALFLVFPSLLLEGMPRTIIESFSCGTPVLASRFGIMETMITENKNGGFFERGDAEALAEMSARFSKNPNLRSEMRVAARNCYKQYYTAERNHELLMEAYELAIRHHRSANQKP